MDINIGAVGAAVIAGLVSLLGLIISKEQKVSEFRQAWIDELRKCLVSYLVNINAVADAVRLRKAPIASESTSLAASYKALNEANHGITLRVNENEKPAKRLIDTMRDFEKLAEDNAALTPENIRIIETRFLKHSRSLLKGEWKRVKRGEKTFVWSKWIVGTITATMIAYLAYLAFFPSHKDSVTPKLTDQNLWLRVSDASGNGSDHLNGFQVTGFGIRVVGSSAITSESY